LKLAPGKHTAFVRGNIFVDGPTAKTHSVRAGIRLDTVFVESAYQWGTEGDNVARSTRLVEQILVFGADYSSSSDEESPPPSVSFSPERLRSSTNRFICSGSC